MADIYRRSHFTICAMNGLSSDSGILSDRFSCKLSSGDSLFMRYLSGSHSSRLTIPKSVEQQDFVALTSRAWTFQEGLLSRRVISFFDEEVTWSCPTYTACECGEQWDNHSAFTGSTFNFSKRGASLRAIYNIIFAAGTTLNVTDNIKPNVNESSFGWRLWNATVEAYAYRKITYQKDKFWALAGVSDPFTQQMGSFHAGLWSKYAAFGLLWERYRTSMPRYERNLSIPSWSWASINKNYIILAPDNHEMKPV